MYGLTEWSVADELAWDALPQRMRARHEEEVAAAFDEGIRAFRMSQAMDDMRTGDAFLLDWLEGDLARLRAVADAWDGRTPVRLIIARLMKAAEARPV